MDKVLAFLSDYSVAASCAGYMVGIILLILMLILLRKKRTGWMITCEMSGLIILALTFVMDFLNPGAGIGTRIFYTPARISQWKAEIQFYTDQNKVYDRLRPAQRLFEVTCPDPNVWATWSETQKAEWRDYYRSFAAPSSLGPECWQPKDFAGYTRGMMKGR